MGRRSQHGCAWVWWGGETMPLHRDAAFIHQGTVNTPMPPSSAPQLAC